VICFVYCRAMFHSTEAPNLNVTVSFPQYFVIMPFMMMMVMMMMMVKSQNTVLQICYALSIHSGESVQLFYKYNLDVTYCCSGAIVAAVCDDFRLVVFAR